ncbi:MAG: FxsA family protein [Gemmatimonadota bacterium]
MWIRLFLLFTLVPLGELWLLLRIGGWIGPGPTLALVLVTGIAGATLARREGAHAWSAVRAEVSAGRIPGRKLLEALLVLMAGIVLVTPGVVTDVIGLLLLVRPLRTRLVERLEERYRRNLGVPRNGSPPSGRVIEI